MIVRFLHLSDFHLKGEGNPVEEFNQDHVTRSLAEKVESLVEDGEAFDFVVVTGDLAFCGKKEDYNVAKVMCKRILKAVGLKPERLFLVPGNHDVDRDAINKWYLVHYQCVSQEDFSAKVKDPEFFDNLTAKFSEFHRFAEEATGVKRYDGKSFHYTETLRIGKKGETDPKINLLGLNSAILAGYKGDDKRHLALGHFQIEAALKSIDKDADLTLAFFHHPFSCFNGYDGLSRVLLMKNADLFLYGHRHKPENYFLKDDNGSGLFIGAGASYEKRESENAFNVVEIDLEKRAGMVRFYEYYPEKSVWRINTRSSSECDSGVFRFQLEAATSGPKEDSGTDFPKKRKTVPMKTGQWEKEVQAYLDKAASYYAWLSLRGFKTNISVPIRIEDLYVPLRAMVHLKSSGDFCYASADEAEEKLYFSGFEHEDINLLEAFPVADKFGKSGLVVLGDPGSGKTTLLKRLLLYCYHEGPQRLGLPPDIVPVFLPLRKLVDVDAGLKAFLKKQLAVRYLEMPGEFAEKLVDEKRALFLFDGLDEVSDPSRRAEVAKWLDDHIKAYGRRHRFVVTCRFAGYTDSSRLNAHFLQMHMRPLSWENAEKFITYWYHVVETGLDEKRDVAQAMVEAKKRAGELIERFREPDFRDRKLFAMTRNPLLLANLCIVHRDKGEIPKSRAELYGEYIEVLLERWRRAGGMDTRLTARTGLAVLQTAAYWMHQEEGRKRATADELAPVIQAVLETQNWEHGSPKEFLDILKDESGLLTGCGDGSYGFMYLWFQEYLAAREIRNRAVVEPKFLEELAERFGQPWFQEVILLFLALKDPSMFVPFMRRVVKQKAFGQPEHAELMEMCLDDAAEPSAEPFLELLVQKPGKSRSLWKRQLAALRALEQMIPDLKNAEFLKPAWKNLENHPLEEIRRWAAGERGLEPQLVKSYDPSGCELVRIPGGIFMMGSEESEKGCYDDERPAHKVNVETFHMGRYPVTNAEYERFLKENPAVKEPDHWRDPQYNRPEQPVVGVSWEDAKTFAVWAGLDLPSESQWEYACRADTTTRYYSGDEEKDLDAAGWYGKNSGERLHPVGEKVPNGFGLFDMHGNVLEWCEDDFHFNYDGAPDDGSAWVDSPRGSARVVRGGSWRNAPDKCRTACRLRYGPAIRDEIMGFRLVFNQKFYRHPLVLKYETRPDLLFSEGFAEFIEAEAHLKKAGKWEALLQSLSMAPERIEQYLMLARAWTSKDTNVLAQALVKIIGLDGGEILTESDTTSQYSAYTFSLPRQIARMEKDTILVFITAMENRNTLFGGMEDAMDRKGVCGRYFFILDLTDEKSAKDVIEHDCPDFKAIELSERDLKNLALSDAPQSLLTRIIAKQAEPSDISPYKTEGPIGEAMFFGRETQLNTIVHTIVRRTLGNYMIFGARKSGKTSLLKALERRFKEKHSKFLDVHFHSLQAASHEDHILKFYREINDNIGSVGDFIRHFSSITPAHPQIFLLDEVDELIAAPKNQRKELISAMRKLKDEGKACFIMAGYWQFYKECLNYGSPIYNFGDRILIKSLDRPSANDLLISPMECLGIRYESKELINEILNATHCRADLIQMVCSKMLAHLPKIGRRTLKQEDFDYATSSADVRHHLVSPIQPPTMTIKEQLLVYATIPEGAFTHRDVSGRFRSYEIPLRTGEFTQACQKLELTNLVDVEGNIYKYNTPLFRTVLLKNDPDMMVQSLVEEIREQGNNG